MTKNERIEHMKKKAAEARAARAASGEKLSRTNPFEKAAASPTSLRLAINAKCFECEGGDADPHVAWRIGNCLVQTCPLHAVRQYRNLEGNSTPKSLQFIRTKVQSA